MVIPKPPRHRVSSGTRLWQHTVAANVENRSGGSLAATFTTKKRAWRWIRFQTVFLVTQKTSAAVMEALASGRVYAVRKENGSTLKLERFSIREKESGRSVLMGQDLLVNTDLVVEGGLSLDGSEEATVDVILIRNGRIWQNFSGQVPLTFRFVDTEQVSGKSFYRLDVRSRTAGRLVSNPIFVTRNL